MGFDYCHRTDCYFRLIKLHDNNIRSDSKTDTPFSLFFFTAGEALDEAKDDMARDRLNQWAALDYFNPTKVLKEAFAQGFQHQLGGRSVFPCDLKRSQRKPLSEALDAAVFAHGLREMMPKRDICIAQFEAQDHDFVLRFGPREAPGYCPLQLKVVVSEDVNPNDTSQSVLDKLAMYSDAADLVVAIKFDRAEVDLHLLTIPPLHVAEVWFFGSFEEDTQAWYLYGDCLGKPNRFKFRLPAPPNCAA